MSLIEKSARTFEIAGLAVKHFVNHALQQVSFRRDWGICKPTSVSIDATNRCNSRCLYCDIWKNDSRERELTTLEWKSVFKHLRSWLGVFNLTISGGEPLVRADIPDLIAYCSELGVLTNLLTNGLALTESKVRLLSKARLNRVAISIDSSVEGENDFVRGVKGHWEKAINAVEYLKLIDPRIKITIASVISSVNISNLSDHVRWAAGLGVSSILFQPVDHNFGTEFRADWHIRSQLWPKDLQSAREQIDKVIEMKTSGYPVQNSIQQLLVMKDYFESPLRSSEDRKCKVGVTNFAIDASGKVNLCYSFKPVGHFLDVNQVRQDNKIVHPVEIWNSKEAKEMRLKIRNCRLSCSVLNCNYELSLIEKAKKFVRIMRG